MEIEIDPIDAVHTGRRSNRGQITYPKKRWYLYWYGVLNKTSQPYFMLFIKAIESRSVFFCA